MPSPKDIHPFYVREIDLTNNQDLQHWCEIVSDAYNDGEYDIKAAQSHFQNHRFLNLLNNFFVMDGERPVGTISVGVYKANLSVGGDARIAIRKSHQGHGLGKFLIAYGFTFLREQGIKLGESVISIPREQSIMLHYGCGFIPQIHSKYFVFKEQRRFWFIRALVRIRLHYLYVKYKKTLFQKFINTAGITL